MNIVEYSDREMLALDVAGVVAEDLEQALHGHDVVSFAVPGGTTPGPVFDALCAVSLDWSRVVILPTDERCVPPQHERSNERLIRERLMVGQAKNARFCALNDAGLDPEAAASRISASVSDLLPLSVLVLGMGADMHTASLFPGTEGVKAALQPDAPALSVLRPADQPEARISLSGHVLSTATKTHLIVTGDDKRAALEKAATLPVEQAPVRLVLDKATVHWAA